MFCLHEDVIAFDNKHNLNCQNVKYTAKYLCTVERNLKSMFFNLKLLAKTYYLPKIQEAIFGTQKDPQLARLLSANYFSVILQFIESVRFLYHGQISTLEHISIVPEKQIHPTINYHYNEISFNPEDNKIRLSIMCLDYYHITIKTTREIYDADYLDTMKRIQINHQQLIQVVADNNLYTIHATLTNCFYRVTKLMF